MKIVNLDKGAMASKVRQIADIIEAPANITFDVDFDYDETGMNIRITHHAVDTEPEKN